MPDTLTRETGMNATALTAEMRDETEIDREMAIREIYAAADRLFEVMPPAFAHQFATEARDEADRKFRMRSRHNGQ